MWHVMSSARQGLSQEIFPACSSPRAPCPKACLHQGSRPSAAPRGDATPGPAVRKGQQSPHSAPHLLQGPFDRQETHLSSWDAPRSLSPSEDQPHAQHHAQPHRHRSFQLCSLEPCAYLLIKGPNLVPIKQPADGSAPPKSQLSQHWEPKHPAMGLAPFWRDPETPKPWWEQQCFLPLNVPGFSNNNKKTKQPPKPRAEPLQDRDAAAA